MGNWAWAFSRVNHPDLVCIDSVLAVQPGRVFIHIRGSHGSVLVANGHDSVHVVRVVGDKVREIFDENANIWPFFYVKSGILVFAQKIFNLNRARGQSEGNKLRGVTTYNIVADGSHWAEITTQQYSPSQNEQSPPSFTRVQHLGGTCMLTLTLTGGNARLYTHTFRWTDGPRDGRTKPISKSAAPD